MGFWEYSRATIRGYHRDPFPHPLLRTRESSEVLEQVAVARPGMDASEGLLGFYRLWGCGAARLTMSLGFGCSRSYETRTA